MANNRVSRYTIELELEAGDTTRRTIDDVERSLQSITDSTKKGLGQGLASATKEAEKLAGVVHDLATGEKDATEELAAYSRASSKAIKSLEKQATTLTYSLSEQGKAQRQRLADLRAELATLGTTKAEIAKKREIEKEIKAIQKDVVEASDAELQAALKQNRTARTNLKLAQQEAKLSKTTAQEQKKLNTLASTELKTLNDKIKAQSRFIDLLKTTEGRYKILSRIGGGLASGAKTVAAVGGGIVGGVMAMASTASGAANAQIDRAREATRIRASMSQDEKERLLSQVYIDTGADASTIVDAINRVVSILGPRASQGDISRAVEAEIRYPGASAMFMQDTENPINSRDFAVYQNRMRAIQGVTGATQDQILASTQKIANLGQGSFSKASMTELQAIYLGLQGSGAFDTEDELNRAFDAFVKSQSRGTKSVFEAFQDFDWEKYGTTDTNRYQIENALRSMQWGALDRAAHTTSTDIQYTAAEETASKLRKMEETKNRLLIKIMEALEPLIDKLDPQVLAKFFESALKLCLYLIPIAEDIVGGLLDGFKLVKDKVTTIADAFTNLDLKEMVKAGYYMIPGVRELVAMFSGELDEKAAGGIASVPSICGEAGPEMVIPLDPSRRPRAEQLTATVMQTFNMSGNETTMLSLASAVRSRDFTRAMSQQAFINTRCGR